MLLGVIGQALAAPVAGLWVPSKDCAADPNRGGCANDHLVEIVEAGDGLEARYRRVSSLFRQYRLPDNLPYFRVTPSSEGGWVGQHAAYFNGADNRCKEQGRLFPARVVVAPSGVELSVFTHDVQVNHRDCTFTVAHAEEKRWFRVQLDPLAALGPAPMGSDDCAAWVAWRDQVLVVELDAMSAEIRRTRSAASIVPLLQEQEQALEELARDGEWGRAQNALARSVELLADRFLDITGMVYKKSAGRWVAAWAGADHALMGVYDSSKCAAKLTRDLIHDAESKSSFEDCLKDKAVFVAGELLSSPATDFMSSLAALSVSVKELKETDDAYKASIYDVRQNLDKMRRALRRYEEELAQLERSWRSVEEINALQLTIAEACNAR